MNELNNAQYAQLQQRVNTLPWTSLVGYLTWTYQGRYLTIDDFPDADDARREQIIEVLGNLPNLEERKDWQDLQEYMDAPDTVALQTLISRLNLYISRWETKKTPGNSVEEARNRMVVAKQQLVSLTAAIENEEWQRVDMFSMDSLVSYYTKYPYTAHKEEIDDTFFSLAKNEPEFRIVPALNRYLEYFPVGKHSGTAARLVQEAVEWTAVKSSRDIQSVHTYICEHPDSIFITSAKALLIELKSVEFNAMKRQFNEYSRERLLGLINCGTLNAQELIYEGVATERSLEILRNYSDVRSALPILDDVIPRCTTQCFPDHTDVFMFGIPGTGKSCVLAGLLGSHSLNYNSVVSGGGYADALIQFVDNNCPPDPTRVNYLTTVKAKVVDGGREHLFDLVEMAGEEFAGVIANNPNGEVCFEDMGSGATGLLANKNKKVFFLIVDPTKERIRFKVDEEVRDENGNVFYRPKTILINQKVCLKRMVDMFGEGKNASVMRNVDAIHFIVTKADTLGKTYEERIESAVNIMNNSYYDSIVTLKEVCETYGINRRTNGVPYVFPFSLGQFFVGNIFEYDEADSATLIDVMKGNTMAICKETFWDKFKKVMNKGF